jgi:hypothetical protein
MRMEIFLFLGNQ